MDFSSANASSMAEESGVENNSTKLVGARKRKPVNISKISSTKTYSSPVHHHTAPVDSVDEEDEDDDYEQYDDEYGGGGGRSVGSEPNNNKIQSILSELKFAKQRNHHVVGLSPRSAASSLASQLTTGQFQQQQKKPDEHQFRNFSPGLKQRASGNVIRGNHHFGGGLVLEEDKLKENDHQRVAAHQPRLTSIPCTPQSQNSFQDEPLDLSVDAVDLRKGSEQQNLAMLMMMMSGGKRGGQHPGDSKRFRSNPSALPSPPPSPPPNIPMDLTSSRTTASAASTASPKNFVDKLLMIGGKMNDSVAHDYERVSSSFGSPPSSCGSNNNPNSEERSVRKYQKRKSGAGGDEMASPNNASVPGKSNNNNNNKSVTPHHHHNNHSPGVKPKQRRYRTERPFHCPHCPARFTLRSNMERHGKHQHASVWQRSPSNRVLNKQRALQAQQSSASNSSTPPQVHSNNSSAHHTHHQASSQSPNPNIRLVLSQQLKRKLSNLEQADLASVETLLEKTGNEDFKKYFRSVAGDYDDEGEEEEEEEEEDNEDDVHTEMVDEHDDNSSRVLLKHDDDRHSYEDDAIDEYDDDRFKEDFYDEEEDDMVVVEEHSSSSKRSLRSNSRTANNKDKSNNANHTAVSGAAGVQQKSLSAYSSAPHKISCPHCSRKFPWTSSLRRHLLTHTGQKPFQCSRCPLLFTTKSNCDRHVTRKHSNAVTITVAAQSDEPILRGKLSGNNNDSDHPPAKEQGEHLEDEDEEEEDDEEEDEDDYDGLVSRTISKQASSAAPDKGVKKIKKLDAAEITAVGNGDAVDGVVSPNTASAASASFRCHLCELSSSVRSTILKHIEDTHADNYALLDVVGGSNSEEGGAGGDTEEASGTGNVTNRKVLCAFCIRRFWSVEDLRRHMRSHTGERPFSCQFCSRRFTLKHSMLRHLKKHGEGAAANNRTNEPESEEVPNNKRSSCAD